MMSQEAPDMDGKKKKRGKIRPVLPEGTPVKKSIWEHFLTVADWWFIALIMALSISFLYAYWKIQEIPLYRSQSAILFAPPESNLQGMALGLSTGRSAWEASLSNYLTLLRSSSFRNQIIDTLTEEEKKLVQEGYKDPDSGKTQSPESILSSANKVHRKGVNIFIFEFQHRNGEAAAFLANRYAEEFTDFLTERKKEGSNSTIRFLRGQVEDLRLRVERGELAVQQFRQDRDLVSLEENQNLVLERMKTISSQLNQSKLELLQLQSELDEVKELEAKGENILNHPSIQSFGNVAAKLDYQADLRMDRSILSERYGKRHPKMLQNQASMAAVEEEMVKAKDRALLFMERRLKDQQRQVADLEKALKKAEQDSLALDEVAIEYNVLRRQLVSDQALFSEFLQRLNEARISAQVVDVNMQIIERANVPGAPFTPDRTKILITSVLLFGVVFFGVPFGLEFLFGKVKSRLQIEYLLGIPFLGTVRGVMFAKRKALMRKILDSDKEEFTEQFRSILTHLFLQIEEFSGLVITVTSLLPKEGKSMFVANLGALMARHERKVLLLECDFRRPTLTHGLGLEASEGILQYVEKQAQTDGTKPGKDSPHITVVKENLHLLCVGGSTEKVSEMMDHLRDEYDIILADSAPAGVFSDSVSFSRYTDAYLIIIKHKSHGLNRLKSLVRMLRETGKPNVGAIFNFAQSGLRNRYYTEDYRYKYQSKYKSKGKKETSSGKPLNGVADKKAGKKESSEVASGQATTTTEKTVKEKETTALKG